MDNAVTSLDGNRLVGLNLDLMQQLRAGAKTLDQLDLFLKGKNPFEEVKGNSLTLPKGSITKTVKVNRSKTPLEVFRSITSHVHHFDESIVAEMPLETKEEVELVFIPIKKIMSCEEYAFFLESHGLKPDPVAQAVYNQENPGFSDDHPNSAQWLNKAGKFCYTI